MTAPNATPAAPAAAALTGLGPADAAAFGDLMAAGTPENTRRAYAGDLAYLAAWKALSFGTPLAWPEREDVALRFILDHARDLAAAAPDDPARQTAETLIAGGRRKSLATPAPATLDRRIAAWRSAHRLRNLPSPFAAPLLREAHARARRATARPRSPKSAHPITREVLERLEAAAAPGLTGLRDRALLLLGWASGGRRRSEIVGLDRDDLLTGTFDSDGIVRIRLWATKTTRPGNTPMLLLKGRAARTLMAWTDAAGIDSGPLFRRISRGGRVGARRLSPAAVTQIIRKLSDAAGLGADFASAHGLRSGFLTQAALDGAPLGAAMRLSLHRSPAQAQSYYDDVDLARNPAADLLDRPLRDRPEGETLPPRKADRP